MWGSASHVEAKVRSSRGDALSVLQVCGILMSLLVSDLRHPWKYGNHVLSVMGQRSARVAVAKV